MTENEIKNTKEWFEDFIETYALSNQETIEFQKAVACLEELQQYRAIGTMEECKIDKIIADKAYKFIMDDYEKYLEYEKIGTIEEFKALKEKATPKKGIPYTSSNNHKFVECPSCHKDMDLYYDFCQHCGQSVDWGKSKT